MAEYPQQTCGPSVFGWRDLAYDGTYLYAADECGIDQIRTKDGSVIQTCPNPAAIMLARALAHDPASGNFWAANFRSNVVEFEMCGAVVQNLPNLGDLAFYGFGWDGVSEGGPYLWGFSQDGGAPGEPQVRASRLATDGSLTGVSFDGAPIGGIPIAGGADVDCDAVKGTLSLVTLHQADPDSLVVYDLEGTCGKAASKEK